MNFRREYTERASVKTSISIEKDPTILIPNLYHYDQLKMKEDRRNAFLHLLAAGNIYCESLFAFSFQPMDCCLLLYTQSGGGSLTTNGVTASLEPDHILLLDCNQRFTLQSKHLPWSFKIFYITGNHLPFFRDLLHAKNAPRFQITEYSSLKQCFNQLISLPTTIELPDFLLMHKLLTDICTTLYIAAQKPDTDKYSKQQTNRTHIPSYIVEMKDRFDNHYADEFSLLQYQERYQVSKYRLCREFSEYYGAPPLRYLNGKRLEMAKEMLLSTELSIHAISSMVGYKNVNHFINLFKKYVGTTPNAFRQTAQEIQPVSHSPVQ